MHSMQMLRGNGFPVMVGCVYAMLALFYGISFLIASQSEGRPLKLSISWWKYMLLAAVDLEANYLVTRAYNYTNITSVMLLDCFTIPVVMGLSRVFLGRRYNRIHAIGVVTCILGLCLVVVSDLISGNNQTQARDP